MLVLLVVLLVRSLFLPLLCLLRLVQVPFDRGELLGHALRIIQPLNGQHEAFALELVGVGPEMLTETLGLHSLADALAVGADGEHAELRSHPQVRDRVDLRCHATHADDARAVVPQVVVRVEPDQVGAEHALNDLGAVRQGADDLERWEWGVEEERDPQLVWGLNFDGRHFRAGHGVKVLDFLAEPNVLRALTGLARLAAAAVRAQELERIQPVREVRGPARQVVGAAVAVLWLLLFLASVQRGRQVLRPHDRGGRLVARAVRR
mmetsp:Transcript_18787/g.37870  ORF Transcript_18787/g.37870 Transcript_18787/m.37870 type:complete len:264 (-) Transcript_18787:666-1457(-)